MPTPDLDPRLTAIAEAIHATPIHPEHPDAGHWMPEARAVLKALAPWLACPKHPTVVASTCEDCHCRECGTELTHSNTPIGGDTCDRCEGDHG